MEEHKKVELVELFYDLVFVYAISQITALIHHLHDGVVSVSSFFAFGITLILYINTWMIETVFVNRFGLRSFRNIGFLFLQMLFLLIASQTVMSNWEVNFVGNMLPLVMISGIMLAQYVVQYFYAEHEEEKRWIRPYFIVLGFRTLTLILALIFPFSIGVIVANISIIGTWILPGILNRRYKTDTSQSFHISHLVERLSLLVIIMFGEMIIGILPYFENGFTWDGFFVFFAVAHLFLVYIIEVDHMIDVSSPHYGVVSTIYWHYSIFAGLSLVTVGLSFIREVGNLFSISVLYMGLILIMLGILAQAAYNKTDLKFSLHVKVKIFLLILAGYLMSIYWVGNTFLLVLIFFVVVSLLGFYFMAYFLSVERRKQNHNQY